MITACIPPGTQPGWQPQRPAYAQPYTYRVEQQQQQQPDADDEDDDDNARGPGAAGEDRGHASGGGGGHSNWTCVAEGSIGKAYANGPTLYENERWPDTGRTRDEAYLKALKGCNALMGNAANLGYLNGQEVESGTCKVVDCRPTGT